jgi:hypothetical protein
MKLGMQQRGTLKIGGEGYEKEKMLDCFDVYGFGVGKF